MVYIYIYIYIMPFRRRGRRGGAYWRRTWSPGAPTCRPAGPKIMMLYKIYIYIYIYIYIIQFASDLVAWCTDLILIYNFDIYITHIGILL